MNNIENDEMLEKLAEYVGVDFKNLEPEDDYERKEIELAHEICGLPYDEIAHFLSRAEIPEFMSPQWIFKALNCNDEFYIQNLALIRATEWMRQEVYAKKEENSNVLDFPFGKLEEPIPDEFILSAAAPGDEVYTLPDSYNGGLAVPYEICCAETEPSKKSPNDFIVDIHLKLNCQQDSFWDSKKFSLKTLATNGRIAYTSPAPVEAKKLTNDIVRLYFTDVPKEKLFGHAWTLSYTEER